MAELSDDRWVRVMADFCAAGLWAKNGAGVGDDDLPVSEVTKDRLRLWQATYDTEDGEVAEPQFSDIGREIARAIKAELPDWTVIYFDNNKAFSDNRDDGDRSAFEYEIT